jgi:hypothetical protein
VLLIHDVSLSYMSAKHAMRIAMRMAIAILQNSFFVKIKIPQKNLRYKGCLQDGNEVAIKVIETPEMAGFDDEMKVLSKFRHPNLVGEFKTD